MSDVHVPVPESSMYGLMQEVKAGASAWFTALSPWLLPFTSLD